MAPIDLDLLDNGTEDLDRHDPVALDGASRHWTFLSNHAHVLVCLATDPDARLRDVAVRVGITERAVQKIVSDLEDGGVIAKVRDGRRNHYRLFLDRPLRTGDLANHLVALRRLGVPYTDAMIENLRADLAAQADPDADHSGLLERYPKAPTGAFDGNRQRLTEMDALIAYLQMLGTLVDFADVTPEALRQ